MAVLRFTILGLYGGFFNKRSMACNALTGTLKQMFQTPVLRKITYLSGVILLLMGAGGTARAQVLYGTLLGAVSDPQKSPAAGVKVVAANEATGQTRVEMTDDLGLYAMRDLQPGTYKVVMSAAGFATTARTAVPVSVNVTTRLDISLQLASTQQTVEVVASAPALQTDKGDIHTDITAKEVQDLPSNAYRNYQTVLNLVPGATPTQFQNAMMDTPGRSLTTNINGTSRNNNITRIDGAVMTFPYLPHQTLYNPPVESIELVNVVTNSFQAEQGLAGGAAITVITKSGTNDLHGVAFGHHNDSNMTARNFFYLKPTLPKNILNQFGGALGGPIKRNKLFYFLSYEGTTQRQESSLITTVPTAAQRSGDFGGLTTIYDGATGAADGKNRTSFTGDQIPQSRLSAAAVKMQSLVPLPNMPGTSNNLFADAVAALDRHQADAKGTWNVNDRSSLFVKYSLMKSTVTGQCALGAGGGRGLVPGGGCGSGDQYVHVGGVGYTRAISPSVLLDASFGFARNSQQVFENDYGKNWGTDVLGIPGTNGPDIQQSGLPSFAINGYETFGNNDSWTPELRHDNVYTYTGALSWTRGPHTIRFGVDLTHTVMSEFQPQRGFGPRGGFTFNGGYTALNGGASPTQYNAYADFLLGAAASLGKSYQYLNPLSVLEWQDALYAQDQWQVNRKLTVTAGVRWEYYPLIRRADRGIERYDLSSNNVLLGCVHNVPCGAGSTVSAHQFAPRLGLAYRINDRTVFRGGYGISIDPYPLSRAMRDPFPVTVAQTIGSVSSYIPAGTLQSGIPAIAPIDLASGVVPLPLDAYTKTLAAGKYRRGYVESFNVTLERQLPLGFILNSSYVATRTIRQDAFVEANAGQTPGAGANGQPLYILFGRKAQTQVVTPYSTANYNSLQTSLLRRFQRGLMLRAAYTYAKAIDFATDSDNALMFNAVWAQAKNRAVSDFDRTHTFQSGFVAELPFGAGKPWLKQSPVVRAIASGWQINGVAAFYTGRPFTVTASGASLNMPFNTQVADQVLPQARILGGAGTTGRWFDTGAFAAVTQARFGNAGRNSMRGPGMQNIDLGVFRKFPISERINLEFRGEALNATNTAHFGNPAASVGSGNFGTITTTAGSMADSRILRVGVRLKF